MLKSYQGGISGMRWVVSPRDDTTGVLQYALRPINGGALDWFDVPTEVATHPAPASASGLTPDHDPGDEGVACKTDGKRCSTYVECAATGCKRASASEPACDPTKTECPRCKNVIANCDGVFASLPASGTSTEVQAPIPQASVAWRDHVEQRMRSWRRSRMNESGDRLALDDFMDTESLDDLIDYVLDEREHPAPPASASTASRVEGPDWPQSWLRDGFNGCMLTAIAALKYLANNDRPSGGQSQFNAEHLHDTAHALALTREKLLVPLASPTPTPAPEARKPLTEAQMEAMYDKASAEVFRCRHDYYAGILDAEVAHGIASPSGAPGEGEAQR